MAPRLFLLLALALAVLAPAPAPADDPPGEVEQLRMEFERLRADQRLVAAAPLAVAEAERAVLEATVDRLKKDERAYRIHLARRRIQLAEAQGRENIARQEIREIEQRRNALLLRASRLEVRQARREAEQAMLLSAATREEMQRAQAEAMSAEERRELADRQAEEARREAEQARRLAEAQATEVELARREAELASQAADSLRRRLEYMEYRETDRGVVVTLGDVLFEVGQTELLPGARQSLEDVIDLLESEPGRSIRIEGHTDSTGPASVNLRLSEQRARAVRDALIEMGIDSNRIQAVGMGEDFPIASNETEEGRSRNRRVDVIVLNE